MSRPGRLDPVPPGAGPARRRGGGAVGALWSSLPSLAVVPVTQLAGVLAGALAGLAVVAAVAVALRVRGDPYRPVIGGLVGVAISSGLTWWTGSAAGGFVIDIWYALGASVVLAGSIAVGRPLVGVGWSISRRRSFGWRRERSTRCGFELATAAMATVFGARFAVQHRLYDAGEVWWLVGAKVLMGYPLTALALLAVLWAVRRAERREPVGGR